jgi:hypothetical protein
MLVSPELALAQIESALRSNTICASPTCPQIPIFPATVNVPEPPLACPAPTAPTMPAFFAPGKPLTTRMRTTVFGVPLFTPIQESSIVYISRILMVSEMMLTKLRCTCRVWLN